MDAVFQEHLIRHFTAQWDVLSYFYALPNNILRLLVLLLPEKHIYDDSVQILDIFKLNL